MLHQGADGPARALLLAAGLWQDQLHDEIWVFDRGFWNKSRDLWVEIQKADWADVILEDDFKQTLKKDVYGFFKSEAVYKELAIPWKVSVQCRRCMKRTTLLTQSDLARNHHARTARFARFLCWNPSC